MHRELDHRGSWSGRGVGHSAATSPWLLLNLDAWAAGYCLTISSKLSCLRRGPAGCGRSDGLNTQGLGDATQGDGVTPEFHTDRHRDAAKAGIV